MKRALPALIGMAMVMALAMATPAKNVQAAGGNGGECRGLPDNFELQALLAKPPPAPVPTVTRAGCSMVSSCGGRLSAEMGNSAPTSHLLAIQTRYGRAARPLPRPKLIRQMPSAAIPFLFPLRVFTLSLSLATLFSA